MTNSPINLEQPDVRPRAELEQTRAELQRLEQLKRNFTMLAAHELRNPLAILLGYAKILEDESSGNAREYAGIVVSRAQQLKSIVDSLIVLQQCDAGELMLQPNNFLIAESIQEVIRNYSQHIQLKAPQIALRLEAGLSVRADRDRVALVLTNLLSNAIKYSQPGGQIVIQTRTDANDVIVSIHDNGVGIPPAEQTRIFDRFYQIGNPLTREHSGLGIGLAVAQAIIELHRGRIWVESAPNQGSTFSFSLPRAYPANASTVLHQALPALL
jgi:two-component system phosphate regulon sensor histidine kinase PhoR